MTYAYSKNMTAYTDFKLDTIQGGAGFMLQLAPTVQKLQSQGYFANLVPRFDHFKCLSRTVVVYPADITVDCMIRFENASDPDDQSILYAITDYSQNLKGLYVDSYGLYHDELSPAMIKALSAKPRF